MPAKAWWRGNLIRSLVIEVIVFKLEGKGDGS
jgi:hypothetical protein